MSIPFYPAPVANEPETWDCFGGDTGHCGPQLYAFRAEAQAFGDGDIRFQFRRFRAVAFTECGAWFEELPEWYPVGVRTRRWIDTRYAGGKRLAHLTKAEAVKSLKARKRRQIAIVSWQLEAAERILDALTEGVMA